MAVTSTLWGTELTIAIDARGEPKESAHSAP